MKTTTVIMMATFASDSTIFYNNVRVRAIAKKV